MLATSSNQPQEFLALIPDKQDSASSTPVLEGYLRREELAKELRVSPRTIDRWQTMRMGPPRVHIGRTILYSADSVREWLRSREHVPSRVMRRRNHRR